MDPDKWRRIKEVFDSAIGLEADVQSEYVAKACQGDDEVLRDVQTLLRHHQEANSRFLNQTPLGTGEVASVANEPRSSHRVGSRIGVYQIVKEIGRGGMGEVYRAARVDGTYEKEVAIKFVRGGFDTASVVERFRNERQILASLDHSNIAGLLDGGTTDDGVPYLVMELIEGTPIDEYCDQHGLAITRRLELFRLVCGAVQYAHQRLVIHRDIKPSNILVGEDGTPKLLDFGIAKILDPTAGSEPTEFRPMTPEYASPEQVRGASITTATDVYSLGVVLYQLLTGRSPYSLKTRDSHELAQAICDRDPQKPSSRILARAPDNKSATTTALRPEPRDNSASKLKRRLSGDLDNILLMALRKEPEKRYASVEQFSDDIRRNIEGLPVRATRGSWTYRARKFVLRNKGGVAAAVVIVLSLALGLMLTLREKRIAERRFNDVRTLANSLIFEIDDSIRDLPGATSARKLLVSRALEYLDRLSGEASGDPSLQRELATAYERVGDVLGHPYAANLGDTAGALASYRKALAIRNSLAANTRDDTKLQNEIVGNYFRIANALEVTSDRTGALNAFQRALPIAQQLAQNSPSSVYADQLAGVHYYIAQLLARGGDQDRALANYEQARAIRSSALEKDTKNISLRSHLAADYIGVANAVELKGRHDEAIGMETKAVEILQQMSHDNPSSASLREYYAESLGQIADLHEAKADHDAALSSARQAHEIFKSLLAADPNDHLARANFGFSDLDMGVPLLHLKKYDEALADFREAAKTFEEMSPEKSSDRYLHSGLARAYSSIGDALLGLAQRRPNTWDSRTVAEARTWYEKSARIWEQKQKLAEIENDESGELNTVLAARSHCNEILTGNSVSHR